MKAYFGTVASLGLKDSVPPERSALHSFSTGGCRKRFHDVGPDQGIGHAVIADRAYALPGSVLVCGDSHTCASGAFNCAARGVGAPDLLGSLTTGKTWFRVGDGPVVDDGRAEKREAEQVADLQRNGPPRFNG